MAEWVIWKYLIQLIIFKCLVELIKFRYVVEFIMLKMCGRVDNVYMSNSCGSVVELITLKICSRIGYVWLYSRVDNTEVCGRVVMVRYVAE